MGAIILFILLVIGLLCYVHAEDIWVDAGAAVSDPCGTIETPCNTIYGGLSLAATDDTVHLEPGRYFGDGNEGIDSINFTATAVTLIGNGDPSEVIIACTESGSGGFYLHGMFLDTIQNITIANCSRTFGGAIRLSSIIININNIIFSGNSATRSGGAIYAENSARINVQNSSFFDNIALLDGAAISSFHSPGPNSILFSTFKGNLCNGSMDTKLSPIIYSVGGKGGAIYAIGTEFIIRHSVFTRNTAVRTGGALYLEDSSLITITNCDFLDNLVVGEVGQCPAESACEIRGGALYANNVALVIVGSSFTSNEAASPNINRVAQGGALYLTAGATTFRLNLVLQDCSFTSNRAVGLGTNNAGGYGGAYYSINQPLTMERCHFSNNWVGTTGLFADVSSAGGALWFSCSFSSVISDSDFEGNYVIGGGGGGMYVTDSLNMQLLRNTFTGNGAVSSYTSSGQGGALMIAHLAVVFMKHCDFFDNMAHPRYDLNPLTFSGVGGGVYVQTAILNATGCHFVNNSVYTGQFDNGAGGGAMLFEDSLGSWIENSTFLQNGAEGYTGFSSYSSSGQGGAIFLKFSSSTISNCIFVNNWVTAGGIELSSGGAIALYFEYTSLTGASVPPSRVMDSLFNGNIAGGSFCEKSQFAKAGQGGAIAIVGVNNVGVSLTNNNFTYNIARCDTVGLMTSFGGAVAGASGSNITADNCYFGLNYAWNGIGDDLSLTNADPDESTEVIMKSSTFLSLNITQAFLLEEMATKIIADACDTVHTLSDVTYPRVSFVSSIPSVPHADFARSPKLRKHYKKIIQRVFQLPQFSDKYELARMISSYSDRTTIGVTGKWHRMLSHNDEEYESIDMDVPLAFVDKVTEEIKRKLDMLEMSDKADSVKREALTEDRMSLRNIVADPAIIVSGKLTLIDPVFDGPYHIFAGDAVELVLLQRNAIEYSATLMIVASVNSKDNDASGLVVTSFKSNVTMIDRIGSSINLKRLNAFNSTISFSNNITVADMCIITSSTLTSFIPLYAVEMAKYFGHNVLDDLVTTTIRFLSPVETGFHTFYNALDDVDAIKFLESFYVKPMMLFEGCVVVIEDVLNISTVAPVDGVNNFTVSPPNLVLDLTNHGMLNITETGRMYLNTDANITSKDSDSIAITNHGEIIVGYVNGYFCTLTLNGPLDQTDTGKVTILLNNWADMAHHSMAALQMYTNEFFAGVVNIQFVGGTTMELYPPDTPTSWVPVTFGEIVNSAVHKTDEAVMLQTPLGLGFTPALTAVGDLYKQEITIDEMSCSSLVTYYTDIVSEASLCHTCLLNSSCGFCATGASSLGGACQKRGSCEEGVESRTLSCCYMNCYGDHGVCRYEGTTDLYVCDCSIYWQGDDCSSLSTVSYILISSGVFLVLLLLMSLRYYYYNKGQKYKVLNELRQGLLDAVDQGEENAVSNSYLQSLQQDLILKDVFVKYEDIKLEAKIGEGSFGVVYKATFRGVQVAVKQMRSPLFQALSEGDIEEFRKEAYMMSRLRHPNIVLVMGISLVDQEPVAKRPVRYPDDEEDEEEPQKTDGKKKLLHKTVCIVTEYLDQGSLADILYGPTRLAPEVWTYELVLTCALQAARGMLYLHSHSPPICHRDLKSSNLVVDDHWVVKVTDFGMSRIIPEKHQQQSLEKDSSKVSKPSHKTIKGAVEEHPDYPGRDSFNSSLNSSSYTAGTQDDTLPGATLIKPSTEFSFSSMIDDRQSNATYKSDIKSIKKDIGKFQQVNNNFNPEMTSNLGTTAWCAPELLTASMKTRYSIKVDVYSFGMVLWELWERKRPYEELTSRFDIMDAIRSGRRPSVSDDCPPPYRSLMQRCWQGDPSRRPMFQYIVRYIKEELARVKRNRPTRSLSTGGSLNAITPSFQDNLGVAVSPPTAPSSYTQSPLQNLVPTWGAFGTSQEPVQPGPAAGSTQSTPIKVPTNNNENTGDRSKLANVQNFPAYLTASPATSSDYTFDHSRSPRVSSVPALYVPASPTVNSVTSSSYYNTSGASQMSSVGNSFGGSAAAGGRSGAANWRDSFVLRQSGWKPSQPDAGLPPSLQGTGGGGGRRGNYGIGTPSNFGNMSALMSAEPETSFREPDLELNDPLQNDVEHMHDRSNRSSLSRSNTRPHSTSL